MKKRKKMTNWYYGESEIERTARYSQNPKVLQDLAEENSNGKILCIKIACNHYCNGATLDILSKSTYGIVRKYVAENPNLQIKTALRLAYDPLINVREALSRSTLYKSVQRVLLNMNSQNDFIVANVLKRSNDELLIDEFLDKSLASDSKSERIVNITNEMLCNDNLSPRHLCKIIEIQKSTGNLNMIWIKKHPNCTGEIALILDNQKIS